MPENTEPRQLAHALREKHAGHSSLFTLRASELAVRCLIHAGDKNTIRAPKVVENAVRRPTSSFTRCLHTALFTFASFDDAIFNYISALTAL